MTKQIEIKTVYHSILENIERESLVNGYFGSSNLLANYLNDYSARGINAFIAGFLQDDIKNLDRTDIEEILDNPDYIIHQAAYEFYDALSGVLDSSGAEFALKNANHLLIHGGRLLHIRKCGYGMSIYYSCGWLQ